jgi:hypothetical protein
MKSWKNNLDNEFQNTGARLDLFSRKKKNNQYNQISCMFIKSFSKEKEKN